MKWQRHAHELAAAFRVKLMEVTKMSATPEEAVALPGLRTVFVAPITDETTYAVALHEMGHVVSPFGALHGTRGLTQEAEDAAWTWARHYALEWTPLMDQVATWARASYDAMPPARPPVPTTPPAPAAPIGQQIDWEDWK